eukprot:SAG31_NODE_737_length_12474_cov_14.694303_2_plen_699_part_00
MKRIRLARKMQRLYPLLTSQTTRDYGLYTFMRRLAAQRYGQITSCNLFSGSTYLVLRKQFVRMLLQFGAQPGLPTQPVASTVAISSCGTTAAMLAIYNEHAETLALLLDAMAAVGPSAGNNVDYRNARGETALHIACKSCSGKSLACAKQLLQSGADPSARGKGGNSCLHLCANSGATALAGLIIKEHRQTLDINAINDGGETALHVACKCGHVSVVSLLLHRCACSQIQSQFTLDAPLHMAAAHGHAAVVHCLLTNDGGVDVDVSTLDKEGRSALHRVVGVRSRMKVAEREMKLAVDVARAACDRSTQELRALTESCNRMQRRLVGLPNRTLAEQSERKLFELQLRKMQARRSWCESRSCADETLSKAMFARLEAMKQVDMLHSEFRVGALGASSASEILDAFSNHDFAVDSALERLETWMHHKNKLRRQRKNAQIGKQNIDKKIAEHRCRLKMLLDGRKKWAQEISQEEGEILALQLEENLDPGSSTVHIELAVTELEMKFIDAAFHDAQYILATWILLQAAPSELRRPDRRRWLPLHWAEASDATQIQKALLIAIFPQAEFEQDLQQNIPSMLRPTTNSAIESQIQHGHCEIDPQVEGCRSCHGSTSVMCVWSQLNPAEKIRAEKKGWTATTWNKSTPTRCDLCVGRGIKSCIENVVSIIKGSTEARAIRQSIEILTRFVLIRQTNSACVALIFS